MTSRSRSLWAKVLSFSFAIVFIGAGATVSIGSFQEPPVTLPVETGTADLSIAVGGVGVSDPSPVAGTPVALTATVLGDASVSSDWVKKGVVLDIGGLGEDLHVSCPSVLRLENGTYLMFYTAKMNDGASTSWYWRMFRAFSYDGLAWHKEGKVLDYGGAYAGNAVYNPYVWIAQDGTYHMWYCGQNYEGGNRARVLHATSPDGFNFVYDRLEINFGSAIEPASVNCPFVLADDAGFRMWYQGTAWSPLKNWVNLAHKSTLAEAWAKDGTVLTNDGLYDNPHAQRPWVLPTDGGYEMFYSGSDAYGVGRILHASSSDGISWKKDGIVLEPSLPQEGIVVRYSSVLNDGGTYKMWYNGYNGTNRIMYAEKSPAHIGQDATCTVNFYLDSVAPENLIGSQADVFVPADGQVQASIEWMAVEGEHQIIAVATDVSPPDPNLSNNAASAPVSVSVPVLLPPRLEASKVMLSGIEEGYTLTYYEWELLITVSNTGGSALDDVVVTDVLPAELQLLGMNVSTGVASFVDLADDSQTRAAPAPPTVYPVKSTHIRWDVGPLEAGQSETLYMTVCTRLNPAGNQEFTSPGTYLINEGALASGLDPATGGLVGTFTQPITVIIEERIVGNITLPPGDDAVASDPLPGNKMCRTEIARRRGMI